MARTESQDGVSLEDKHWQETCEHVENEGAGICLGLLASSIIRFIISGHLPPIDGDPKYKTGTEVNEYVAVCMFLCLPVAAMCAVTTFTEKHASGRPYIVRGVEVAGQVVAMTWGWSFVFLSRWIFWSSEHVKEFGLTSKMSARVTCAVLGSVFGFVIIFLIDFVADRMNATS